MSRLSYDFARNKTVRAVHLERRVELLNSITFSPSEPYTITDGGRKAHCNVNHFFLYWGNGGVALHRYSNEKGGFTTITSTCTKRELYGLLTAYIDGIILGLETMRRE